jgi:hypothetical protein
MGATALTVTEKRTRKAYVYGQNGVYTRTVQFTLVPGDSAAAANLTGFVLPAGTTVLSGTVTYSVAQGSSQMKFSTATADICAKMAHNATTAFHLGTIVPFVCPSDEQVTYTISDAAIPAGAGQTCTLTLVLAATGLEVPRSAAVGV